MTCGCESAEGKCSMVSVCYMEQEIADVAEDRDALARELAEARELLLRARDRIWESRGYQLNYDPETAAVLAAIEAAIQEGER